MKKILATALALTLTFGTFALPAAESGVCIADKFAVSAGAESYDDNDDEYRYGEFDYEDFQYDILDDGTIEIKDYAGSNESVNIPSTIDGKAVTSIGKSTFYYNKAVTSVTIPESITNIGQDAFYHCDNITSITVPKNVESIGLCAFYSLGIEKISVDVRNKYYASKDGVLFNKKQTELLAYPLGSKRTEYTVPNSVTSINERSFTSAVNLKTLTIPDSVANIGYLAFYCCKKLETVNLPKNITRIENSTFTHCESLKNITLPDSLTSIGKYVFDGCKSLTSISIPYGVTTIDYETFSGCSSLTNVTIPNSVTEIKSEAFKFCDSLKHVIIPDSITEIKDSAFYSCDDLSCLFLPKSVKLIDPKAFENCDKLTDIYYEGSEEEWNKITFYSNNNQTINFKNATKNYNFTFDPSTAKYAFSCDVSLPPVTQYFRGTRIKPIVTVKDGDKVLKCGTDYTAIYKDNLVAGKASVIIKGKGDYIGTTVENYMIVQRSVANCDVKLDSDSYYYNGTEVFPSVKLFANGKELYDGNYTLFYSNNLSAGTATVIIKGQKSLKGTFRKSFKIKPRALAECTVELTKNSDNEYQPTAAVKIDSNTIDSENYTVKYTTSADKKTVKVTLTGKKNLTGSVTKTYTVQ